MLQSLKSLLNRNAPNNTFYNSNSFRPRSPWMGNGMGNYRGPTMLPNRGFGGRGPMPPQRQGGLLSKIFGAKNAGNQANMAGNFFTPPVYNSSTLGQTATNASGSKVMGWLNNAQKILKTAETAGPMIQQYGPLIKNIPSMIQLMREFNDLEDTDQSESNNDLNENESGSEEENEDHEEQFNNREDQDNFIEEDVDLKNRYGDVTTSELDYKNQNSYEELEQFFEEEGNKGTSTNVKSDHVEIKNQVNQKRKKPYEIKKSVPKVYL